MTKKIKESAVKKSEKELSNYSDILKNVATKKDLEILATKNDLRKLDSRVDGLDSKVDRLSNKVDRLEEGMVTKTEFAEFRNETITRIDKVLSVLGRHEQERIFAYEASSRQA